MATLIFSGSSWIWFAAGAGSVGLILLCWGYRRTPAGLWQWLCALLKAIGLAALAFCLLEPLWSSQHARPGANLFALVADNSQGLQIKDPGESRTRGELLRALLDPQHTHWQETLEQNFEVRRYLFDTRLQNTRDFGELTFDGRASAIGSALHTLRERYRGRPLAGILMLTDGNATDVHGDLDLEGLPPIYPVVIGGRSAVKDIAIQQVRVSQTDFEDAPVTVQADVSENGFDGESIQAVLTDQTGKQVAEQVIRARKSDEPLAFRFQLRPENPGLCFYRLVVGAKNPTNLPSAAKSEEATLANNHTVLVVDRGHGPFRILYVAGRPNWEFKFLNRAVSEDEQLQMVGLIRIARREPKFTFMGRPGETGNPLFRGFGNQAPEEVEHYDKPVLIRLNTKDELELRSGFPATPEDLYAYHAIIIDDLEAEFFTSDQAALLQRFVSERGGGLLMLGGMECFQQGKYQRTPIGDMLPIYLDRSDENKPSGPVHFNLTPEGWLQTWARLRDNESAEKSRLQSMAPFFVLNPVHEAKPGASVIATVSDPAGKTWPALVVQRFGRGRTGALMIGDLWHWGLHDAEAHHDMDKAWRQFMRWLVTDVPNRVDLTALPAPDSANGAVNLQVRVRDARFQPLDNASVILEIQPVMTESTGAQLTNTVHLTVEAAASEPGLYEATYVPRLTGGYRATVSVTNASGTEVGKAETGWTTDLVADEFHSLSPNVAFLENIAQKTGGEVIRNLDQFARNLPQHHAPVMESWTRPIWHTPALFAFALTCFLSEWGLRRWRGLP